MQAQTNTVVTTNEHEAWVPPPPGTKEGRDLDEVLQGAAYGIASGALNDQLKVELRVRGDRLLVLTRGAAGSGSSEIALQRPQDFFRTLSSLGNASPGDRSDAYVGNFRVDLRRIDSMSPGGSLQDLFGTTLFDVSVDLRAEEAELRLYPVSLNMP